MRNWTLFLGFDGKNDQKVLSAKKVKIETCDILILSNEEGGNTIMCSFNVITDPWVPVLKDDMVSLCSVRDVLKYAPDIKCITSPGSLPSEEYAIYRFLFALLTDAYRIENDDDILDIWESGAFDLEVFDEYVEESGNVFDIFDEERPFMQCPVKTALEYGAAPVAAAVLNWAQLSGNTETFFRLGGGVSLGENL